ncbi:conserved Plasmodium protein, unknown function [Plasmodium relictum]|uniref:Uncharacterized protein n=1 Tax=Plasmodium relictum TaxID=85471 RepID=A0A1J1HCS7_PLARL|nr:conserved Plasmodium protein, unknown function [Plasmodium relictum]CRH03723.1 conserved Plasmodium protein, unknown function [Plasmodium relictum]
MEYNKLLLSVFIFSLFFLLNNKIQCQTFLPVSYATHHLYSFDKLTPHEIKSNLKKTIVNFITTKLENIKSKFQRNDNNDDIKNEYETSLEDKVKSLLQQAKNKRILSKKIKGSYDRALKNLKKKGNTVNEEKITKILEHNLEQIKYLNKKSDYLEKRAEDLKKHLEETKNENYKQNNNCNISKIGKLKFVTSSNGLKHSIDNVQGNVNQNGFTIFHKNKKKMTYYWNVIELPIKVIGSVEQCFFFVYRNNNQIFCAENKLKSYSWINSLSEASLCYNFDIKGIIINKNIINDKLIKKKKINENMLTVDIKPEENSTRIFVNDVEQKLKDNEDIIDLNKIKKNMEDEKKINKKSEITSGINNEREYQTEDSNENDEDSENETEE